MERFVHRKNVERYQEMLKTLSDPEQQEMIKKLLAALQSGRRIQKTEVVVACPLLPALDILRGCVFCVVIRCRLSMVLDPPYLIYERAVAQRLPLPNA